MPRWAWLQQARQSSLVTAWSLRESRSTPARRCGCLTASSRRRRASTHNGEQMNTHGVTRTDSILDRIVIDLRALREEQKRLEPEATLRARFIDRDASWGISQAIQSPRGHASKETPVQII